MTFNNLECIKLCIDSIRKFTTNPIEIIVIDNGSKDGTVQWLSDQNDILKIYNNDNLGFPKGCNQGIELASGDNIMLLNNDVIVTPNWLNNLLKALYSDVNIGAVGAVSNYCSYHQAVQANYNNIDEIYSFADKYNTSNEDMWEARIRLIAFCMLIKREIIDKIGLLDERFTPGNYEDDDYSYRILSAGYKLLLCKDTFVHHFGHVSFRDNQQSYLDLLKENEKKFEEKWGFNSFYSSCIRYEIINLIDKDKNAPINVLEIGCACGATLLKIKDNFRNAKLYGIELNENSANIAKNFAQVEVLNIEASNLFFNEKMFDYIIFADVLEHLSDPWEALQNIKKYLKDDGYILASIPNVMHHSIIRDLINGNWTYKDSGLLDRTHLRFFTLKEIIKMFKASGYTKLEFNTNNTGLSEADEVFIDKLCKMSNENLKFQFSTFQYLIKARKNIDVSTHVHNRIRGGLFITREKIIDVSMPLVSILIPSYNRPKFLEIALESAIKQTYKNIEIIICDDSTNDEVFSMIENYTKKYDNIRYYKNKKNIGQFENDLKLIELSRGDYINFLMDDDVFESNKIEMMMECYLSDNNNEIKLVTSHRQLIDEIGNRLPDILATTKLLEEDNILNGIDFGNFVLINGLNCIGEPTTPLFRKKDLIEPFGVFNDRKYGCNVDLATWLNLLSEGKIVYLSKTLSYFRIHSEQQLNSNTMLLLGATDYAHEIITARQKGFLKNIEEYNSAILNCINYIGKVKNLVEGNPFDKIKFDELTKYYLQLCQIANS